MLSHLACPGKRLGVCDLFGEQGENVSASGSGNRATFEANMADLAPDSIVSMCSPPRRID